MPTPNRNQKSNHRPHLLVQKSIATHHKHNPRTPLLHIKRKYRPLRRRQFTIGIRRERHKIMLPNKVTRRLSHRLHIHLTMRKRPIRRHVRRQNPIRIQLIPILFPNRRKPRIKTLRRIRRLQNPHRHRQLRIHRPHQILRRYRFRQMKVRHKSLRMHTRIRPRRTIHPHRRTIQPRQNLFHNLLYPQRIRLILPARIRRAVIRNLNLVFPRRFHFF